MGQATVQKAAAPLHLGPSRETMLIDETLYGMSVQVLDEMGDGWSHVRTEYGVQGYVQSADLNLSAEVAVAWKKYKKHVVLAGYMDVQARPQREAPRIISIPRGGLVVALKEPDFAGWQKVGLANGAMGFTRASYLGAMIDNWSLLREDDMRWNLVESALAYNGTAYRVGGRTTHGMDAPGLAAMAYMLNGVNIPREPNFREGGALHLIAVKAADEGDLLYFRDSVGIMMDKGRFIHATEEVGVEGVVVNSMNPRDENYRENLVNGIIGAASLF